MTKPTAPDPAVAFINIHPVLSVEDLPRDLAHYRDRLGFEIAWQWGDPPTRAGVRRNGLEIQLVSDGRFAPGHPSHVYFHLRGVDHYYQACVDRGAEIIASVDDRPFGMRDFRVVDPSGNFLGFGEPIPR